ncbi:MAG TPA: HlyD family type I secretion periplasmic adaptor subunit [Pseudomonadales bacterium]|nr:HlyD family type I secretion periplasmic adaptor subunit [Pseudomonadales bacterium]
MKFLSFLYRDFNHERLQFLPAALEIQQSPPHPLARWLGLSVMAFFSVALVWACVGKVDVVAVAEGKIIPSARVKQIQPLEKGVIKEIFVHEGQRVKAGEPLVSLDRTSTGADRDRMANELQEAQQTLRRSKAFLALLQTGIVEENDDPQLQKQWQQYSAQLAALHSQHDNRVAEKKQNGEVINKLEATLPMINQRADNLKMLADKKMVAQDQYLQLEEQRIGQRQDLAAAKAHDTQLAAAIAESQQQIAGLVAQAQSKTLAEIDDGDRKVKSLTEEWRKAQDFDAKQMLYAPIAGQVKDLAINTVGGVVLEAQQLMLIVPEEEQLEVQVWLPNQDIGFVHEHDAAQIKVHTFPFTKYGTVPATITRISDDAVADEKQAREQGGLVYSVSLLMEKNSLWVDTRNVKLMPGMQVTAEIITQQRRIIEYFLSPIQKHLQESVRER